MAAILFSCLDVPTLFNVQLLHTKMLYLYIIRNVYVYEFEQIGFGGHKTLM